MKKQLFSLVLFTLSILLVSAKETPIRNQLKNKAIKALKKNKVDSARYYFHQLLRKKSIDYNTVAMCYNNLGMIDFREGFTTRGLEYFNKAIEAYEKSNNDTLLAISLYNTGKSYKMLAQYDKAAEFLIRALKIFEANNKVSYLSKTYNVLGNLYRETSDFEIALKYHDIACEKALEIKDSTLLAKHLNNRGTTYMEMEYFEEANHNYNQALKIKLEKNLNKSSAFTYYNLAEVEIQRAKYNKALYYLKKSLDIHEIYKNKRQIAYCYNLLGETYKLKGTLEKALFYLKKAEDLATNLDMDQLLLDNYKLQYKLNGSFDKDEAIKYAELYINLYTKVLNEEKQKIINELQIQYEVEKKEQENTLLNQKSEIDQLKIKQQEDSIWFWRWVTVATVIIILFVLVLSLKYYKLFEKEKALAKREKELNTEQHHRIKNHLQVLAGLLSFQQRKIQDHIAKEIILESKNRVEVIKMLHQHFYQNEMYDGTDIQMHNYLKEIIENLIILFDKREIQKDLSIKKVAVSPDKALPLGLVCNEIISNALKYGLNHKSESILKVSLDKKKHIIELVISDNGDGFKDNDINPDSIGLDLINQLVSQIDGKINKVNSQGVKYTIEFRDKKREN